MIFMREYFSKEQLKFVGLWNHVCDIQSIFHEMVPAQCNKLVLIRNKTNDRFGSYPPIRGHNCVYPLIRGHNCVTKSSIVTKVSIHHLYRGHRFPPAESSISVILIIIINVPPILHNFIIINVIAFRGFFVLSQISTLLCSTPKHLLHLALKKKF